MHQDKIPLFIEHNPWSFMDQPPSCELQKASKEAFSCVTHCCTLWF